MSPALIDTHTHFDAAVFDQDRIKQAVLAKQCGVEHILLVGFVARYFARLRDCQQQLKQWQPQAPMAHVALGLHPFYIDQHHEQDLNQLSDWAQRHRPVAIGEIGLDTYTKAMKTPACRRKQKRFFNEQLDVAVAQRLPVLLHIRKAHAESLQILKAHAYDAHQLGGIAHSFSGGEQEAKAFVKLGFKLGVTGQITNPNAKKLRRAIQAAVAYAGPSCLVIETDCPDMLPKPCQVSVDASLAKGEKSNLRRNTPANLPYVLETLTELLDLPKATLALQLWQNSCAALQVTWENPTCECQRHTGIDKEGLDI